MPASAAKRRAQQKANRLARLMEAVEADDEGLAHLNAAFDFWRASLKRTPLEDRPGHRTRLAELLTSDAMQNLDSNSTWHNTRLEAVA